MKRRIEHYLAAVLLLASASLAGAQEARLHDPLRPLLGCALGDGVKVSSVDRVTAGTTRRFVDTDGGKAAVSIADGYRVMVSTGAAEPFVKLMIELSAPGQIDADRNTILAQMNSFSSRYGPSSRFLKDERPRGGIETIYFDFSPVGELAPSGITTLIAADKSVVATVYLLARQPSAQAKAAHRAFVDTLTACLSR